MGVCWCYFSVSVKVVTRVGYDVNLFSLAELLELQVEKKMLYLCYIHAYNAPVQLMFSYYLSEQIWWVFVANPIQHLPCNMGLSNNDCHTNYSYLKSPKSKYINMEKTRTHQLMLLHTFTVTMNWCWHLLLAKEY